MKRCEYLISLSGNRGVDGKLDRKPEKDTLQTHRGGKSLPYFFLGFVARIRKKESSLSKDRSDEAELNDLMIPRRL
ncbi:hypothetical protein A946_07610 [Methylacidiphilum kamchatkense Kam1]|uniref:Uncharacterized protein n=1 Tax=Methylacidiphilum kamchatkense Kam1 TaxID=1202785 RepID=A0ABR4ZW70_9BACT|nr:hypothetical protein A946_07610 [Methylacidiphilum kamchatkense Kam1]